jgi:hypothetical protein
MAWRGPALPALRFQIVNVFTRDRGCPPADRVMTYSGRGVIRANCE